MILEKQKKRKQVKCLKNLTQNENEDIFSISHQYGNSNPVYLTPSCGTGTPWAKKCPWWRYLNDITSNLS